jgi:hypothetical protein
LIERINKLSDEKSIDLERNPPVRDPEIEKAITARDPTNQRSMKGAVARQILRMRVVLSERSDADQVGLVWGGDFQSFKDKPHFEFHPNLTLAQANQRRESNQNLLA